jgi:hypothetical protein
MKSVRVEVFPVAADRWIGVIDGERGAFSTECRHPDEMRDVAARDAAGVLGRPDLTLELVDDLGEPWTPDAAAAQLERFVQAGDAMPGPFLRP